MMPVFMAIAFGVQKFTRNATDVKDRAFVVVDRTGALYAPLAAAAEDWNRAVTATGAQTAPRFLPSRGHLRRGGSSRRAPRCPTASSRSELYAFVEIPADALDPAVDRARCATTRTTRPTAPLPTWIANTVNREIMTHRFREAAIDRALVTRLTKRVDVAELGLLQRDAAGAIRPRRRSTRSARWRSRSG